MACKEYMEICKNSETSVVLVDRDCNKIKEFDTTTGNLTTISGSGTPASKDGCKSSASFAQPTGVCCENGTSSLYVVDCSTGRLRILTSTQALAKYLDNLWHFMSAYGLTSKEDATDFQEIQNRVQEYYAFHEECSLEVQKIKGFTNATQGPDGTLSSNSLNSVKMILEGLEKLKDRVMRVNPSFVIHLHPHSLLTLFVENLFASMRGGNTNTPMMLDFCLRLPRCINEQLKRVTTTSFNYFTNPRYYLEPKLGNIQVHFKELAKIPKPIASSLAKKHKDELRNWAMQDGKAVRQNTTRNFSTKDKPGTLPVNLYTQAPPDPHTVNFDILLNDEPPVDHATSAQARIVFPKLTYVVLYKMILPSTLSTDQSLFIAKLLEDVTDDFDRMNNAVRVSLLRQDFLDPLLFNATENVESVRRGCIAGAVNSMRPIDEDSLEVDEEEYYVLLALANGSTDSTSAEEVELLDHSESEAESEEEETHQESRPKRTRSRPTDNIYHFY